MRKRTKSIEPRRFILDSPAPPLTEAEVRNFILRHDFPPSWGQSMETELKSRLTVLGFHQTWCQCQEIHRIVRMRMSYGLGEMPPAAAIKRLLRRIAKELGCGVSHGG